MQNSEDHTILAEAFLNHYLNKDEADFWAWESLHSMVRENPKQSVKVILLLLEKAPTKLAISYIAASPLEDLLKHHGMWVIEGLKEEAQHNKRLRYALAHVIVPEGPVRRELDPLFEKYNLRERDILDI